METSKHWAGTQQHLSKDSSPKYRKYWEQWTVTITEIYQAGMAYLCWYQNASLILSIENHCHKYAIFGSINEGRR